MLTDDDIFRACQMALERDPAPIPTRLIAEGAGMSEQDAVCALMRASTAHHAMLRFRYPPLPEGALKKIIVAA
jgi:hypothetical protein